jgi:hypothetical protein
MKNLIIVAVCIIYIVSAACQKRISAAKQAIVVRDCTGVYLRMEEKDYLVCNVSLLEGKENGASVHVFFRKIDECLRPEARCLLFHPAEGIISIIKIQ